MRERVERLVGGRVVIRRGVPFFDSNFGGGKEVLRRRRGLVLTLEDVIEEVIIGEGVEGIREDDEGMGEEGGE